MLIGILQCGHLPDAIRDRHGDYDVLYRKLLAGRGLEFASWSVVDMEFPPSPTACEGWLISGSRFGAYENAPFIAPLEDLIRKAHAAGVPIVGICFGHQIVAQALGGKVEKFSGGWSVGRTEYASDEGAFTLNAWHQDQVITPPKGAVTTASTPFCAHAALAYPGGIYTIQPHPEFDGGVTRDLIEIRGAQSGIPRELLDAAIEQIDQPTSDVAMADRIADHFHAHMRRELRHG